MESVANCAAIKHEAGRVAGSVRVLMRARVLMHELGQRFLSEAPQADARVM